MPAELVSRQCACRGEFDECEAEGHRPTPDGKDRCRRPSATDHPTVEGAGLCVECADDMAARIVERYWDLVWAMSWQEERDA